MNIFLVATWAIFPTQSIENFPVAQNKFTYLASTIIRGFNGSIEIAAHLNLCDFILDLVSSGKTLAENQMVELQKILDVSSYFIANRASFKTANRQINQLIKLFDAARQQA